MLDIERAPGEGFIMETKGAGGHGTGAHIRLTCSNQGKTPARIIEIRARLLAGIRPLPPEPDLNIEILEAGPFYLQPGMPFVKDTLIYGEGGAGIGEMVVIYGVVRYTHLFSAQEVHTTFGYRVIHRELRRLEGEQYRKYNENT